MPRGLALLGPTRRDRSCLEYLAAKPGDGDGKCEWGKKHELTWQWPVESWSPGDQLET